MFKDLRALLKARKNPAAAKILAVKMAQDQAKNQIDGTIARFNIVFFGLITAAVLIGALGIYLGIHLGAAFYALTLLAAGIGWLINKIRLSMKRKILAAKTSVLQIAAGLSAPPSSEPSPDT